MSTPYKGLSDQEVAERYRAGLANVATAKTSQSVGKIIAGNIFTYFNFIFLLISILLASAGSSLRNFTFLPIILANSLIGIIQELRAKRILDNLEVLSTPITRAIRNGKLTRLPITDLVQDDIIFLKSGDQISADAEILSGEVSVNEALLTGESEEIPKNPGAKLMSGSFIIHGECYARLTHVGNASYASALTLKARAIKPGEQSEIVRSLNNFVRFAGITIVPLGIIMVAQQLLKGSPYPIAIEAMVAAIISMIPEGLFLLASVTLVLSATRLARQQVLLHDMKSIETLARVDTLCVDKTGTITSGKMKVKDTIWLKSADTYYPALAATVSALSADSETMTALKSAYKKKSPSAEDFSEITSVQGFSSRLKYSGVSFQKSTFVIGAPELVLREDLSTFKDQLASLESQGLRVLIFAKYNGKLKDQPLTSKATPIALIVIEDEIRPSAITTFRYFAEQGVTIKVISGDSPITVSAIAKRAGIANADKYLDLSTPLTDKELKDAVKNYTIFSRVTPIDKRRLVKALQDAGHTVAMTGDGVNDVLALKDADCSIAMASGAQAAAGAAQMVLLDSDFSKMPSVVAEGRRVVNNLERSGSLFIVKNLFSFSAAILTILIGVTYPMTPAQVSLVSLWAIGIPSFLLAQIPNTNLIRGDFMTKILSVAMPTAITSVILTLDANLLAHAIHISPDLYGTISILVWAGVSLTHLFLVTHPYTRLSLTICILCLSGVILSFLTAKPLFGLSHDMTIPAWLIVFSLMFLSYPLILLFRKLINRVFHELSYRG